MTLFRVHREQASIHKITKYIKNSYAGPLLKKEVSAIIQLFKIKKNLLLVLLEVQKFQQKLK